MGLAIALVAQRHALGDNAQDAARIKAAAEEFDQGRRAFKVGDFEVAAGHFENADRDAPTPEALRMAMKAREKAKQAARAATLAALSLTRYPDDKQTQKAAKELLAKAEKSLHRVEVKCAPECTVIVDKKLSAFNAARSSVIYLEPGSHVLVASWGSEQGKPIDVDAKPGGESRFSLDQPPKKEEPPPVASASVSAAPPPPPVEARKPLPRGVFYGGLGLTAVLAGVSIWSGVDMMNSPGRDKVRQDCAGRGESCPTYQDGLAKQTRTNVLFAVTGGVAVLTAVAGAFFTDWQGEPSGEQAPTEPAPEAPPVARRVVPIVNVGDGVLIGASGRF